MGEREGGEREREREREREGGGGGGRGDLGGIARWRGGMCSYNV